MCFNAGMADRAVRVVGGLMLVLGGLLSENYIVALVGAVPLTTGVIGFCPMYPIFKFNSGCKKK